MSPVLRPSRLDGAILNGTYRIGELLGRGGMGAVYAAVHTRLTRKVAVKVLDASRADHPATLLRFEREATSASTIGNPHIVEVLDFNTSEDGSPYLVMELLEGENLGQRISREAPMRLRRAVSIVRQVASGLQAAHEAGVIHRDLKPSNIFLCRRGERDDYVKVLDFGISKVASATLQVTAAYATVGTPAYMSPEQAQGRSAEADPRTDIYALGVITYQMLAGEVPHHGDSLADMLFKRINEEPTPLAQRRPELPPRVCAVVHTALARRRRDRPSSAAEFSASLVDAAGLEPRSLAAVPTEDRELDWRDGPTARAALPFDERATAIARPKTPLDPLPPVPQATRGETVGATIGETVEATIGETVEATIGETAETIATGSAVALPREPSVTAPVATRAGARPPIARARLVPLLQLAAVVVLLAGATIAAVVFWPDSDRERGSRRPAPAPIGGIGPSLADASAPEVYTRQHARVDAGAAVDVAAVAARRRLTVISTPSGAEVRFAGRRLGRSPLRAVAVPIRGSTLELRRAGYRRWRRRIAPGRADLRIEARLKRARATIRVATKLGERPTWATIYLDGKPRGPSPIELLVSAGRHRIEARRQGYSPAVRVVRVREGSTTTVLLRLRRP